MLPIEQTSTEAAPGGGDTKVVHAGLDTVPVGLSAVSTRTLSPSIPIGTAGRGTPALWGGGMGAWAGLRGRKGRPAQLRRLRAIWLSTGGRRLGRHTTRSHTSGQPCSGKCPEHEGFQERWQKVYRVGSCKLRARIWPQPIWSFLLI